MNHTNIQDLQNQLASAANTVEEIDLMNALARVLILDDIERADQLAQKALQQSRGELANGRPYEKGLAVSAAVLGTIAKERFDYITALSWLNDAQIRLAKLDERAVLRQVLLDLGWVYFNLGNFPQAIEVLLQSLKIARDDPNPLIEAGILNTLGAVYGENGDKQDSIEALQRALKCLESADAPHLHCRILNNLAMTQYEIHAYEQALESASHSCEIALQCGSEDLLVSTLDTTGQIYLAMGDFASAGSYFKKALAGFHGLGNDPVEIILNLARTAEGQGQLEEAMRLLNQAFESIETRSAYRFRYQYHEILARIYESMGDFTQAIVNFKRFHEIKSQAYGEETQHRLGNLVVSQQAETARIDAEIYRLKNLALRQEIFAHRQVVAEMEILATTDSLTGLMNRRHLITLGGYAYDTARKANQPLTVLMIDIDDFKKVNDRFGHPAGDEVLIEVSTAIQSSLRKADLLCRYGGEEFVAVLPETGLISAQRVADRILKRVVQPITRLGITDIRVTLSIGIALAEPSDTSLEACITRADEALYAAKKAGKNQAAVAWINDSI